MGSIQDIVAIAKDISQIIDDLVNCQLRQLTELYGQMLARLLAWLVIALTAVFLAIGGLSLIMWGVHLVLSLVTGPAASAFILGAFLLLIALIIYLVGRGMLKS
ncbi:MAG: hypothetical protein IH624_04605 [Phycisphaerae bacterium]|nr:hypothetical protein [Phycisphaerae bacterium]